MKTERDVVEYLRRLSGFNYTAKLMKERAVRDGWEHDVWVVSLSRDGRSVTVLFRSGSGYRENGEPTTPHIADVLASLLSDAAGSDAHATIIRQAADVGGATEGTKARILRMIGAKP